MKVSLNLATRPLVTHRKFLVLAGSIAFLAGVFFLTLGWHVYKGRRADAQLRDRTEQVRQQMVKLQQQRGDLEHFFKLEENARLNERAKVLNGVIIARSFNWTKMFMDLERILPAGVHVVSIEPHQEKGNVEVKLTVGATSEEAKLKLLRALEDSHSFSHIQLLGDHTPSQAGEDQKILELTALYSRI
jgi:type IV pilus assembly protein PilN